MTSNDKNKINEKSLEQLIEMNIKKGVDGFYVSGSTAEAFLLTEEERRHLYKLVKDIVGNRCTLIAHIGCVGTLQTIDYGKYVESLGYDAISSVAPFYYKFSFEEIKQNYYMTANAWAMDGCTMSAGSPLSGRSTKTSGVSFRQASQMSRTSSTVTLPAQASTMLFRL